MSHADIRRECRTCADKKPLIEFPFKAKMRQGRGYHCSACEPFRTKSAQGGDRLQDIEPRQDHELAAFNHKRYAERHRKRACMCGTILSSYHEGDICYLCERLTKEAS